MNIFKAIYYGLKETVRLVRPVFLIYFVNFILGAIVVIPVWGIIDSEIGNTLIIKESLTELRSVIAADFLANSPERLKIIFSQIILISSIYWFISIFFSGGIIRTLSQDKFTMTSFFSGSAYNFFRFLGISSTMMVLQIFAAVLIYLPCFLLVQNFAQTWSESVLVNIFYSAIGIHSILALMLIPVSDFSKFHSFLYNSGNFLKSVLSGFRYFFKNFFKTSALYVILAIIPIGLFWLYVLIESKFAIEPSFGIWLVIALSQIFIFLRIWLRIFIYAAPLQLFTYDFLQQDDVKTKIAIIEDWNKKAIIQMKEDKRAEIQRIKQAKINNIPENKILTEEEILATLNIRHNGQNGNSETGSAETGIIENQEISNQVTDIKEVEFISEIKQEEKILETTKPETTFIENKIENKIENIIEKEVEKVVEEKIIDEKIIEEKIKKEVKSEVNKTNNTNNSKTEKETKENGKIAENSNKKLVIPNIPEPVELSIQEKEEVKNEIIEEKISPEKTKNLEAIGRKRKNSDKEIILKIEKTTDNIDVKKTIKEIEETIKKLDKEV